MINSNKFDPETAPQEELDEIADAIENYLDQLEEVMIFPDDMSEKDIRRMEEGIRRSRKLIKKLRKGDRSVFRDKEDWQYL